MWGKLERQERVRRARADVLQLLVLKGCQGRTGKEKWTGTGEGEQMHNGAARGASGAQATKAARPAKARRTGWWAAGPTQARGR